MRFHFLAFLAFLNLGSFGQNPPLARKTDSKQTKFGTTISNEYDWLEEMRSPEVEEWVKKQNDYVDEQHKQIKQKISSEETIKIYDQSTTYSLPRSKGRYLYAYYLTDKKKPASLFMMKSLNEYPIEIINPNKIYPDKNATINGYYPSKNSSFLAYAVGLNGSDRYEVHFHDLFKNKGIDDQLKDVKFSNIVWNKDHGVFYKKNLNKQQFEKDSTYHLYYHRLNSPQTEDILVYDISKKDGTYDFFTSKTKLFLIETNKEETLTNYYYAELDDPSLTLKKFKESTNDEFNLINYIKGRIYYSTNKYNWGEVRSYNLTDEKDDKQVIPQIYNHLLIGTYFSDDYLICKYRSFNQIYFIFYDYAGKLVKKINIPENMNMVYQNFDESTKDFYFGVTSYTIPYRNFKVNIITGTEQQVFSKTTSAKSTLFPLDYFETKKITYKNRENIDIPMTLVYKKGLKIDGNTPTLLEAYGGFGVISTPNYNTGLIYFLEKGGLYAYPEIRGGGEKGIQWAKSGKGLKKINGLNDFIDAAEFLIAQKYTNPNKLAISGASQGGLLIGYALTQRPELFKIAIPKVGVFDMLNAKKYSVGRFHLDEYGDSDNETDFNSILKYSPLHNIKEDINYPITLIITADNDDRVPPLHSYKFAAKLQNRAAQKNPIYLRTNKDQGHHGGNNYQKRISENAEFYNFIMYHLMQ
ncbi:MAG TPA: prolyl oligopeptidase family serine peptidase [Flavobacterium sp.]|nr:prolyl oligopeptidase family serine peptidase [Flavobacterium sp.]